MGIDNIIYTYMIKLKSSTTEHDKAHTYEAIVPMLNASINLEEDSMDKNIAYGPIYIGP